MPILDLHQPEPDYAENEHENELIDYAYRIDRLQAIAPHPANPDWGATVYFDPNKYPDDFAQERVRSYYLRNHPGREFRFMELDPCDLEQASPFLTRTAENGFLARGFYADVETANYARGQGDDVLMQSRLMRSVCGHQLAKIASFYNGDGDAVLAWDSAIGRLMGRFVVPVPLVQEDAVYWPRREFPDPSTIHFAHTNKVETVLRDGIADTFGLTRATDRDVAFQVAFESAASESLFNGASREALFLWQTQALAMLRKTTWSALLSSDRSFRKFMKDLAQARRRLLRQVERRGREALDRNAIELNNPVLQSIEEMKDAYLDDLTGRAHGNYGPGLRPSDFSYDLDPTEVLVAAIQGSTYCPWGDPEDEYDRHDPLYTVFPVASWLGRPKRHRYLQLDTVMASHILVVTAIVDEDETSYGCRSFKPLLRERFGDQAWDAIVETAHEVITQERSIPVRYDWTRDALRPRSVERRNCGLVLVGPLLDFPLRDSAIWNHRALDLPNRLALPGWN